MVVIEEFSSAVSQMSLHRNLTVITKEEVETQIIYLDLVNDFDLKKIRILIGGYGPFPEWKLITIILFSIIGFLILAGVMAVLIKRIRSNRGYTDEMGDEGKKEVRESLMTEHSNENINNSSIGSNKYSGNYGNFDTRARESEYKRESS